MRVAVIVIPGKLPGGGNIDLGLGGEQNSVWCWHRVQRYSGDMARAPVRDAAHSAEGYGVS